MKHPLITDIAYKTGEYKDGIHFHNGYEIIFITKGAISVTIDDESFDASEGTLLFISNLENHTIRVTRTPYERYFMNISPPQCDKVIADVDLIALLRCRPIGFKHTVQFDEDAAKIRALWDLLLQEHEGQDGYSADVTAAILKTMLILAKRKLPESMLGEESHIKLLLHEFQDYLDNHFTEDIRISDICRQYYANHFYLTHSFKAYTG